MALTFRVLSLTLLVMSNNLVMAADHKSVHQLQDETSIIKYLHYYVDYSNSLSLNDIHQNRLLLNFGINNTGELRLGYLNDVLWLYLPIHYKPNDKQHSEQRYINFLPAINVRNFSVFSFHQSKNSTQLSNIRASSDGLINFFKPGLHHVYIKIYRDSLANFALSMSIDSKRNKDTKLEVGFESLIYGFFICILLLLFLQTFTLSERFLSGLRFLLSFFALLILLEFAGIIETTSTQYRLFLEQAYAVSFLMLILYHYPSKNSISFFYAILTVALLSSVISVFFTADIQFIVMKYSSAAIMLLVIVFVVNQLRKNKTNFSVLQFLPIPILYCIDFLINFSGLSLEIRGTFFGHMIYVAQSFILLMFAEFSHLKKNHTDLESYSNWKENLIDQINHLANETHSLIGGNFQHRHELQNFPEIRQLAYNLNTLANVLEHSQRSRKQWVADISHELRTPLTILKGEMEAILDGIRPLDDAAVSSFYQEICRITKLVQDLHELSLSDKAELILDCQNTEVESLIKQQLKLYQPTLEQHKIEVNTHFGNQSTFLHIDADRFIQLLVNLIKNTIKYTDTPGKLLITTYTRENQWVMLWEDSSPSVPENMLGQLFSRLFRGERSRNSRSGGSGLGLSLCKSIVAAHNGKIYAKLSKLGGLTIEVVLPIAIAKPK